jgi:glycopeptide antibiotics resistance protein
MDACRPSNIKIFVVLIYMFLLLASSAIPMDQEIQGLQFVIDLKPTIQNLLHIPAYIVLAILLLQIFQNSHIADWRRNALVLLGAGLIGILSEMIQIVVPGRYGGMADIGLNFIGTIAGILIYSFIEKAKPGLIRRIVCE